MSRELPQDVEKALEALANGWGREPTFAHPDCNCIAEAQRRMDGRAYDRGEPCPVHPKARR